MKYLDEFRDPVAARALFDSIKRTATRCWGASLKYCAINCLSTKFTDLPLNCSSAGHGGCAPNNKASGVTCSHCARTMSLSCLGMETPINQLRTA